MNVGEIAMPTLIASKRIGSRDVDSCNKENDNSINSMHTLGWCHIYEETDSNLMLLHDYMFKWVKLNANRRGDFSCSKSYMNLYITITLMKKIRDDIVHDRMRLEVSEAALKVCVTHGLVDMPCHFQLCSEQHKSTGCCSYLQFSWWYSFPTKT